MRKMQKYTVVLARQDETFDPEVVVVNARDPDDAQEAAEMDGYVVVAVFAGEQKPL